jgi:hypothetical protein
LAELEKVGQVLVVLIVERKIDLEIEIIKWDDSIEIEKEDDFKGCDLDLISHEI